MVINLTDSEDKDRYYLNINDQRVGEVIMQEYNGYIALSHIDIYKEFRGDHYGKVTVKFLLDSCSKGVLVGESLKTSAKFWNNCINTFGGYTIKKVKMFSNTAFAFVVGTNEELDENLLRTLLEMCADY